MTFFEAYDAILAAAGAPRHADRVARMRQDFERRTGELPTSGGPPGGDRWSEGLEARLRAFWDDALVAQGFAAEIAGELPEAAREWVARISGAHRGLFTLVGASGGARIIRDTWGGAEFLVHDIDDATRLALSAASAPFDARLVGQSAPPRIAMMPGAVFHPADAAEPIAKVLARARETKRTTDEVLGALLRMERDLRVSARVKAAYAYRLERL